MDAGEEHGAAQAGGGDLVAVGAGDALDQAVLAEPAQVVGGLAGGDRAGRPAEVFGEKLPQVAVEEPAGVQPEDQQDVQECLGPGVGEPQPGGAGAVFAGDGVAGGVQGVGAGDGVVAESLDAKQAPVGGVADLPQGGQVSQPFADAEVRVWLMVVSVRRAVPSLWYCLIWVCL